VWHTQTQLELELAIFAYVDQYNHDYMHEVLGDLPPTEYETRAHRCPARPRSQTKPYKPSPQ